jgi:predicted GNAT family acetyltransferase
MTPAERAFWAKLRMRASRLEPSLERAMLDGFENLRRMLSDAELLRLIDNAEAMLDGPLSEQAMDRAFAKLQDELQNGVNDATRLFGKDIGDGIRFNYLNPRFIDAIRQLNTKVMQTLREDVREVVRSHIEQGLRSGVGPRVMARGIRDVVGLSPTHEKYISNYRRALQMGDRKKAMTYLLRDRRFDATLNKGIAPSLPKPRIALSLADEIIGASYGQVDGQVVARVNGKVVGILDYSKYEGILKVKHVEVLGDVRRQGVATQMYDKMLASNPEARLGRATMTPEGVAFRKYYDARQRAEKLGYKPLTPEQIDKMVERYRERWVKHNAETNARTASIDAMKLGQRLSWEDAISKGVVNAEDLQEEWITAGDDRVRESHEKMNGEKKPFNGVYSNGQTIPGESEFNCRCISRVTVKRKIAA